MARRWTIGVAVALLSAPAVLAQWNPYPKVRGKVEAGDAAVFADGSGRWLEAGTNAGWAAVSNAVVQQAARGQEAYEWAATNPPGSGAAYDDAWTNLLGLGAWIGRHDTNGYLTTYAETDPGWAAVSNAVTTNALNGNAAYAWGDHAAAGYLAIPSANAIDFLNCWLTNLNTASTFTFSSGASYGLMDFQNWATAYGWGNHAGAGYLTAEADPSALLANGQRAAAGDLNMGGNNITNIGNTTGLIFSDGTVLNALYLGGAAPWGVAVSGDSGDELMGWTGVSNLISSMIGVAAGGATQLVSYGNAATGTYDAASQTLTAPQESDPVWAAVSNTVLNGTDFLRCQGADELNLNNTTTQLTFTNSVQGAGCTMGVENNVVTNLVVGGVYYVSCSGTAEQLDSGYTFGMIPGATDATIMAYTPSSLIQHANASELMYHARSAIVCPTLGGATIRGLVSHGDPEDDVDVSSKRLDVIRIK